MMRITVNKDAQGLVDYFTRSLAKDDYFFSGKNTVGHFGGLLSKTLGVTNRVTQKAFNRLAYNRHPVTGERLTKLNKPGRIVSLEYTFSAPKSISILMALSTEEVRREILQAHRFSVKKAMEAIEQNFVIDKRVNGRRQIVPTDGIAYAHFVHLTSRPVKENDLETVKFSSDPNLHSHAIVFNVGVEDGKFSALEGGKIHRSASYFESIYHSNLSKRLSDLQYDIKSTKDRYEINVNGMTKRTLDKFSRRTQEINELAQKLGITDKKAKSKLGAVSRLKKSAEDKDLDLRGLWQSKLSVLEHQAIMNPKIAYKDHRGALGAKQAIDRALGHYLERRSVVPVKKLLSHALNLGYGRLLPEDVHKELNSRTNIIYGQTKFHELLTTKEIIRSEDKLLEWVSSTKGTMRAINPDYQVRQDFLNDQQRKAIYTLVNTSQDKISVLLGVSGSGKSTILKEILWAAHERNQKVIGLAPSAIASREVLRSMSFSKADTIASFLNNKDLQTKSKGAILIIDEASMIGLKTFHEIRKVAIKNKNKIILSGDPSQLTSPERCDAMRLIIDKCRPTIGAISLIQRQNPNPAYKSAIALIAKDKVRQGYDRLLKMGAVIEIEDNDKRLEYIADQYLQSLEAKRSALIVTPTNRERRRINEIVRNRLKSCGRIQKEDRSFIMHKNLSFTASQKQNVTQYEDGMSVQFFRMIKGIKAGVHYDVQRAVPGKGVIIKERRTTKEVVLPLKDHDLYQVYQKGRIDLSVGDQISITQNGKTMQGTRISNGQSFAIKSFTAEGHIELSTGKIINKGFAHVDYSYSTTAYKAQGKTCDDVLVSIGDESLMAVTDKAFYVASSRAREKIQIITQDKGQLKEAVNRSGERMSARELADNEKAKSIQKLQRQYYDLQTKNIQSYERTKTKSKVDIRRTYGLQK